VLGGALRPHSVSGAVDAEGLLVDLGDQLAELDIRGYLYPTPERSPANDISH
jgi:hypothetical protein